MSKHVKVKPLEWGEPRETDDGAVAQDAVSACGRYIAADGGWFACGLTGWHPASSLEAAKAAAQSDYESRILSALEPSPAFDAMVEALEDTKTWAEQRCPCHEEQPNPCPLCGASVENLEPCKSAENTIPANVLSGIRTALALARGER